MKRRRGDEGEGSREGREGKRGGGVGGSGRVSQWGTESSRAWVGKPKRSAPARAFLQASDASLAKAGLVGWSGWLDSLARWAWG